MRRERAVDVNRLTRRRFGALAGGALLSGCAAPGLEAPEIVTQDDRKDPFEGGIGGTGIVGLLTDFGSLRINGLRVEVTERTLFDSPVGRVSESAVAPGMPLTVSAERTRDALVARRVTIAWPLVGTVERSGSGFSVNGARVRPEAGSIGRLTPGARVAVSGVWRGGMVVASRLDPAPQGRDLIAGAAGRGGPTGFTVEGVPVRMRGAVRLPLSGSYVTLFGEIRDGLFEGTASEVGRFARSGRELRQLSVEGYLAPISTAPGFRVAGLGHSFAPDLALAPLATQRALYFGRYDGRFAAGLALPVPESFAARRSLLREGVPDRGVRLR
ncbi:MAG: DUF5666 domain-containing protein [Pseudomonadota bacterium]